MRMRKRSPAETRRAWALGLPSPSHINQQWKGGFFFGCCSSWMIVVRSCRVFFPRPPVRQTSLGAISSLYSFYCRKFNWQQQQQQQQHRRQHRRRVANGMCCGREDHWSSSCSSSYSVLPFHPTRTRQSVLYAPSSSSPSSSSRLLDCAFDTCGRSVGRSGQSHAIYHARNGS